MSAAHSSIYAAISAVMNDIDGFVQKRSSQGLNYTYASESDIIDATREAMNKHGLVVIPSGVRDLRVEKRESAKGTAMTHVIGFFTFTFACGDCAPHIAEALGEALDTSDKASNKAMTQALKYVLRQTFLLITSDEADKSRKTSKERAKPTLQPLTAAAFKAQFQRHAETNGDDTPAGEHAARLLSKLMSAAYINAPNTSDATRMEVMSWLTDREIKSGLQLTRSEIGFLLDHFATSDNQLSESGKTELLDILIMMRSEGDSPVWNEQTKGDIWSYAEERGIKAKDMYSVARVKNEAEFYLTYTPERALGLIDSMAIEA